MGDEVITKKVRVSSLKKAMSYVASQLGKLKDSNDQFNDIARICDLNAPRITEAYREQSMSESTLKKLMKGGIVDLEKMLKSIKDLEAKEAKYLRNLASNAKEIADESALALDSGLSIKEIAAAIRAARIEKNKK